jgi:thermostable 8-oxoguanine DNA glycosylase
MESKDVTDDIIEMHLSPEVIPGTATLNSVFRRLVESAQNRGMMPRVIGRSINGIDSLRDLLFDFDPARVAERGWEATELMNHIRRDLRPTGQVREGPRALWTRFCQSIVSGAAFLSQFDSIDDFRKWVEFFDNDERARPALPMIIDQEIDGIGFALACDFLKELGYINFSKPDVHLKAIFSSLGLSKSSRNYDVFKAIARIASNSGVSPYAVDKMFWLVGSGNFHLSGVRIKGRRGEFIARCRTELRPL